MGIEDRAIEVGLSPLLLSRLQNPELRRIDLWRPLYAALSSLAELPETPEGVLHESPLFSQNIAYMRKAHQEGFLPFACLTSIFYSNGVNIERAEDGSIISWEIDSELSELLFSFELPYLTVYHDQGIFEHFVSTEVAALAARRESGGYRG